MAAKKGYGFGGMKSAFGRTKQKMLAQFGKSDTTVDVQYNQEKVRFDGQIKALKKLRKATEAYQKALQALAKAHSTMTEQIHGLYDASCPLWNACLAQEKVTNDIDNLRNQLEEHWQGDFYEPFAEHLAQYKVLAERMEERDRRLVDMDRYRYDVKKLLEKTGPQHQAKAQMAKEKAEAMTRAYQAMNVELLRDIPALVEDRFGFFDPLFATLVDGQSQYFTQASSSFSQLTAYFNGVDRKGSHGRPRVITDSEQSAYSQPIYMPGGQVVGSHVKENDHRHNPAADAGLTDVSSLSRGEGFVSGAEQAPAYGQQPAAAQSAYQPPAAQAAFQPPPAQQQQQQQPVYQPPAQQQPAFQPPAQQQIPPQQQAPAGRGGRGGRGMRGGPGRGGRGMRGGPRGGARGGPAGGPRPRGASGAGRTLPSPGGAPQVRAKALYPFQAQDESELGFEWNDVIIIHRQDGEWWEGELNGRRGLLPSTYVELI